MLDIISYNNNKISLVLLYGTISNRLLLTFFSFLNLGKKHVKTKRLDKYRVLFCRTKDQPC